MPRSDFVEYIIGDQLSDVHGMSARAMFGGFSIYREGTIVGIVINDELYLKVDRTNQDTYIAMGSAPFEYQKKDGTKTTMSYWNVPLEVVEDREQLITLIDVSYEISLAQALTTKAKKKKSVTKTRK